MDAPVSGGSQGAQKGTLTIMAGGNAEVFATVRPIFEAMGKAENIFHVGPVGSGEVVKIANQILCGVIAAANAEALVLGAKAGADVATMAHIIGVSSGGNWQLANQFPVRVFNGGFVPGFMTDLLHKDLGLALDLAAQEQVPATLTAVARQMYEVARAKGHGRSDYTSVVLELEEIAGVQLRTAQEGA
jgi:3-hydroxyisobutyrate dehydrogenase-like beta-hydroxyacid dehydrogenase